MRGFSVRRSDDLFNDPPPRRDWTWMTAGDVAKVLAVTRQWVHGLAEAGQLAGERTMGRQWIFRWRDVRSLVLRQADERARTRDARLRVVRTRMLKVPPWRRETPRARPRQLAFAFPPPPLRLVTPCSSTGAGDARGLPARGGERAVVDRQVNRAKSFDEWGGSVKIDYVNRKAARR